MHRILLALFIALGDESLIGPVSRWTWGPRALIRLVSGLKPQRSWLSEEQSIKDIQMGSKYKSTIIRYWSICRDRYRRIDMSCCLKEISRVKLHYEGIAMAEPAMNNPSNEDNVQMRGCKLSASYHRHLLYRSLIYSIPIDCLCDDPLWVCTIVIWAASLRLEHRLTPVARCWYAYIKITFSKLNTFRELVVHTKWRHVGGYLAFFNFKRSMLGLNNPNSLWTS